jgi:Tol biopolymer transport system component
MKLLKIMALLAAVGLVFAQGESALQKAIRKETLEGDLKGAIESYKRLARDKDRTVAARALVRLGECYEKQGNADAAKTYEQVLGRFGDQKEAVEQARVRLAALGAGPRTGPTTRTVWRGNKMDSEMAVSSDGRYISYPDWHTGNLALHDLVSGTDRALTSTGTWKQGESEFAETSAWSRDGKRVAYGWYEKKTNRYALRVADVTGGAAPRQLFSSPEMRWVSPRDWSPDGKWIVVGLEPENSDARTPQPVQAGMKAELALVNAQDGSLHTLKTTEWHGPDTGFGMILFSPDGKYVAYDRPGAGHERDVFVLASDGNREMPVATGPMEEELAGWSPDGKYLLFTSDRTGSTGLWARAFADGAPQGEPLLVKPDIGRISALGTSSAGSLFYYVPPARTLQHVQIATFDFETGKLLPPVADVGEEGVLESQMQPDWSPDGKYLAYLSRGTLGFSIKVRSFETGAVHELRPKLYVPQSLRWAPDGRSLAVVDTGGAVYRVDAATGEFSLLVQGNGGVPAWSPDGKKFYYRKLVSQELAFFELDLGSGRERELIHRALLGGPRLSPDGRYIATASGDSAASARTFILIPVAGGEPRELMRAGSKGDYSNLNLDLLMWAPDSRSLLIRKTFNDGKQSGELWQASLDGSPARKLDGELDPRLATGGPRMHPDRLRIAFSPRPRGEARPQEVCVLENFLPVAKGSPAAK